MTLSQLRAEIATVAADLGRDELRVLRAVAERLRMGARAYGPLDVEGDARDWKREAAEEALDMAVYSAAELLRTGPSPTEIAHRVARVRARRVAAERSACR